MSEERNPETNDGGRIDRPELPRLDYATPPPKEPTALPYVGGFVLGLFVVATVGFFAFATLVPIGGPAIPTLRMTTGRWMTVALFVAVVVIGSVALASSSNRRKPFLLGFCTGSVMMSMIEGLCFSVG